MRSEDKGGLKGPEVDEYGYERLGDVVRGGEPAVPKECQEEMNRNTLDSIPV